MSDNFDMYQSDYHVRRFPDPQEAKVFAICEACGVEIYEGETYFELPDGTILCSDILSLNKFGQKSH